MTRTTRELSPLSPNFRTTRTGGHFAPTDLTKSYMAILRLNGVSNLKPSGSEVETLSPGHRGSSIYKKPVCPSVRVHANSKTEKRNELGK
ncbi:hypothetical protein AVEN_247251-1 [Araneus ventricosus]|uniref:Uncharacterized protein n=1 Tax=Araneus ventricosus TaxID=182803 RepID=A0A4Y2QTL7_ARAVE|nr:hypothetical protein AVEN_46347-1 [Araneus ventricosus]GBN67445.1 hypothetical protein AVEN_247251-1 [Araneus ventricosus]